MQLNKVIIEDLDNIIKEPIEWEKLNNSTVMITGVGGMIASYMLYTFLHLNDTRNANIKVVGLVRNEEKARKRFTTLLDRGDFELLVQDVTTPISYEGTIDYVIHAASQTGPRQFVEDPVGTIAANTIGTKNILDFAVEKNAKGFIFLSTREIYGKNMEGKEFVSEEEYGVTDPTLVRSCYPESKRMSETLCAAYKHQYGLNCKVARIAHTYGPGLLIGDGRVVGDFLNNVIHNEDIVMNSDGSAILALTYISDTIAGLFYVMLNFEDFVYNVSKDDEPISVKELALTLCNLYPEKGIKAVFKEVDPSQKAGYLAHKIALLSSKKAIEEGWNPAVNVESGFRRMVSYLIDGE